MSNDRAVETDAQPEETAELGAPAPVDEAQHSDVGSDAFAQGLESDKVWRQPANDRAIEDIRALLLAPVSTHRDRR